MPPPWDDRTLPGHELALLALKEPQPGMVLMTLVPRGDTLLAEVLVRNEDVGFVHQGQHVKRKVAAYPFQRHGSSPGQLWIPQLSIY